eukprot:TRINITY_DN910_c0_g1_i3.p1 TRINITY_DN910_c0_g1~~TRINITY_DN910_c0_g1_i3.p1  ORF type:complete len:239 (-),score=31.68 TRINITY_DN910_c0_g1_i3:1231-1869(-)
MAATIAAQSVTLFSKQIGASTSSSQISSAIFGNGRHFKRTRIFRVRAGEVVKEKPRKGSKQPTKETLLTPRFYTTDFDEMEMLFNTEMNKNLDQSEFEALLEEFRTDYNQTHFVRNPEFKEAANKLEGPLRNIFVEFLERSCTAEFSGFLLYKELGRRLKKTNPVVAEIFSLMSRDEARHAGYVFIIYVSFEEKSSAFASSKRLIDHCEAGF